MQRRLAEERAVMEKTLFAALELVAGHKEHINSTLDRTEQHARAVKAAVSK